MNYSDIIKKNDFKFSKSLGQNFIYDENLLTSIVLEDAQITKEDIVVEIGTGAGSLTRILSQNAKKVYTFEVDKKLEKILTETLKDCDNVQVYFKDILKLSDSEFKEMVPENFILVANIPYYITSPIIMRFLESDLEYRSLNIMMQKEVADRLVAKPGTKDYGSLTVAANFYCNVEVKRFIDRHKFYPVPNVDSSFVIFNKIDKKYDVKNFDIFKKTYRSAFLMRRKTLVNNLNNSFKIEKEKLVDILKNLNLDENIRGEKLSVGQFVSLSNYLEKITK
ncbi:MAG: 16S rRNA (adenine(1518)-N(6)/adenine(1519)-N(6))-dimethyltransferase RsmA [Clostridia bacterium]|nr:16S rRNA (adenine(1518)-N(6)/adenine(1519)-N(6))-dimethyltransferase RsmA [Clostridia bacterium]